MDILLLCKALIMGIVEGITEFFPISSTGHLILAGDLINFDDGKGKVFEVVIQLGAILAVCWEYRARIAALAERAVRSDVHLMTSSGGVMAGRVAARFPVQLIESGPAATALGGFTRRAAVLACPRGQGPVPRRESQPPAAPGPRARGGPIPC